MTVAVIDNDADVLHGMMLLLEGWGCQCIAGGSLGDVLAILQDRDIVPEAIIADYHLDIGDGISAIISLREKFGAHLPAILATADHGRDLKDEAAKLDIRLLNKPLKPAALRALVTQWRILEGAPL